MEVMGRRESRNRPELSPRMLLAAYASGAFPMPDPDEPDDILWFSPDPRGLLPLDGTFHVARRLARTIRQGRFTCTIDRAFEQVMLACADRPEGSWINDDFLAAYTHLHELGLAHSVEAWEVQRDAHGTGLFARCHGVVPANRHGRKPATDSEAIAPKQLAGGVYGVAIGGAFFAESMFHRATDAGKVALVHLVEHLRQRGFLVCDIQWLTDHLKTLGGIEVPRAEYLSQLASAIGKKAQF